LLLTKWLISRAQDKVLLATLQQNHVRSARRAVVHAAQIS
jgi:hypothetical protein